MVSCLEKVPGYPAVLYNIAIESLFYRYIIIDI